MVSLKQIGWFTSRFPLFKINEVIGHFQNLFKSKLSNIEGSIINDIGVFRIIIYLFQAFRYLLQIWTFDRTFITISM